MSPSISLSVADVERRFLRLGLQARFSDLERNQWSTTPIVTDSARVFAFSTPEDNSGLTLKNIKDLVGSDPKRLPAIFDHDWYQGEAFMIRSCPPGWHVLHMDILPETVNQPLNYSRSLAGRGFELPAAVEVVLMMFLHYVETKEQLLFRSHTWCSDQATLDRQVTVGAFGRNGVFLSGHPQGFSSRGLGICPKVSRA
jgi:hypothetical protein